MKEAAVTKQLMSLELV